MGDTPEPGWLPDPEKAERLRYWDGQRWTKHISEDGVQAEDQLNKFEGQRWQYAVVNIGMFSAVGRMSLVLGSAGSQGWELIGVYDKASNWLANMEKGFMLLKRPVPDSWQLADDEWCIMLSVTGS